MIKLLELRTYMLDVNNDLYEMFQEMPYKDEFRQTNEYNGKTKEYIKMDIINRMKTAYSLNLKRNILPNETYILYVDDKPVAMAGLRLKLNKYWLIHSGNIWYKTRPSERGKGYATTMVKLLIERAKEFGLTEIFASCDGENYASRKVLLNNNFEKYNCEYAKGKKWKNQEFYRKKL